MNAADVVRLLGKVDFGDDCWEWTAGRFSGPRGGYGAFAIGRRTVRAHRVMYEVVVGPIPSDLEPDHLCRNRGCVRPSHLEWVTPQENKTRGDSPVGLNARKDRCVRGHAFDEANTYLRPSGGRRCRMCNANYRRQAAA